MIKNFIISFCFCTAIVLLVISLCFSPISAYADGTIEASTCSGTCDVADDGACAGTSGTCSGTSNGKHCNCHTKTKPDGKNSCSCSTG